MPESTRRPISLNERFSKIPAARETTVKATFSPPAAARRERIGQSIVQQQEVGRSQRHNVVQERRMAPSPAERNPFPPVSRGPVSTSRGATITTRAGKVVSTQNRVLPRQQQQAPVPFAQPTMLTPNFPAFQSLFPPAFRVPFPTNPMSMYPIPPIAHLRPPMALGRGGGRGGRGGGSFTPFSRGGGNVGRGGGGIRRGGGTGGGPLSKTALDDDMDSYFKSRGGAKSTTSDDDNTLSSSSSPLDAAELARAGQPVATEAYQEEAAEAVVEDIGVLNS